MKHLNRGWHAQLQKKKRRGNSKEPEDLESLSVALFIYILLLLGLLYSEFRINGIRNYEAIQTR